jgi:hypothetical protein
VRIVQVILARVTSQDDLHHYTFLLRQPAYANLPMSQDNLGYHPFFATPTCLRKFADQLACDIMGL